MSSVLFRRITRTTVIVLTCAWCFVPEAIAQPTSEQVAERKRIERELIREFGDTYQGGWEIELSPSELGAILDFFEFEIEKENLSKNTLEGYVSQSNRAALENLKGTPYYERLTEGLDLTDRTLVREVPREKSPPKEAPRLGILGPNGDPLGGTAPTRSLIQPSPTENSPVLPPVNQAVESIAGKSSTQVTQESGIVVVFGPTLPGVDVADLDRRTAEYSRLAEVWKEIRRRWNLLSESEQQSLIDVRFLDREAKLRYVYQFHPTLRLKSNAPERARNLFGRVEWEWLGGSLEIRSPRYDPVSLCGVFPNRHEITSYVGKESEVFYGDTLPRREASFHFHLSPKSTEALPPWEEQLSRVGGLRALAIARMLQSFARYQDAFSQDPQNRAFDSLRNKALIRILDEKFHVEGREQPQGLVLEMKEFIEVMAAPTPEAAQTLIRDRLKPLLTERAIEQVFSAAPHVGLLLAPYLEDQMLDRYLPGLEQRIEQYGIRGGIQDWSEDLVNKGYFYLMESLTMAQKIHFVVRWSRALEKAGDRFSPDFFDAILPVFPEILEGVRAEAAEGRGALESSMRQAFLHHLSHNEEPAEILSVLAPAIFSEKSPEIGPFLEEVIKTGTKTNKETHFYIVETLKVAGADHRDATLNAISLMLTRGGAEPELDPSLKVLLINKVKSLIPVGETVPAVLMATLEAMAINETESRRVKNAAARSVQDLLGKNGLSDREGVRPEHRFASAMGAMKKLQDLSLIPGYRELLLRRVGALVVGGDFSEVELKEILKSEVSEEVRRDWISEIIRAGRSLPKDHRFPEELNRWLVAQGDHNPPALKAEIFESLLERGMMSEEALATWSEGLILNSNPMPYDRENLVLSLEEASQTYSSESLRYRQILKNVFFELLEREGRDSVVGDAVLERIVKAISHLGIAPGEASRIATSLLRVLENRGVMTPVTFAEIRTVFSLTLGVLDPNDAFRLQREVADAEAKPDIPLWRKRRLEEVGKALAGICIVLRSRRAQGGSL